MFVPLAGAVQDAIFPVPVAAESPILVFELVQLNVEPVGELPKLPILSREPGQTAIFEIGVTIGVEKTVTLKLIGVPAHPLRWGVTVIVPTKFEDVPFGGAVHEAIFPEPLASIPMLVFELIQVNVAPFILGTKFPIFIVDPAQTEISKI